MKPINQELKLAIKDFWKRWKRLSPPSEKVLLLREIADRDFNYGRSRAREKQMRRQFDRKKRKHYRDECLVCGRLPQLIHHIIQIRHGGNNWPENMMPLCQDCHAEIHPWLKK